MKTQLSLFLSILLWFNSQAQEYRSLAGEWKFKLDEKNQGIENQWQNTNLPDRIKLPGTTDEAGYGQKTVGSDFGILTRAYKYYGPAWYQKQVIIPQEWEGKRVFLELERVMWESRLYIDGKEISKKDALNSAHIHDLGYLSPGEHTITIRINNDLIHNIGDKGHAYTEYTQSIWNGAVGNIRLIAKESIRFSMPHITTNVNPNNCIITDTIVNETRKKQQVQVTLSLKERGHDDIFHKETKTLTLAPGKNRFTFTSNTLKDLKLWDDMNPNLYDINLVITSKKKNQLLDSYAQELGFREITVSKSKMLVNGQPVFLRGNLDCVHFPLTGYPSCDIEEWERIFRIYKDYGLNHARFHSWCPPRAAFIAADRIGIYLQPETIWIDWWMTNTPKDRPEMLTKGTPQGLGKNPSADHYIPLELQRMVDAYGNHASFAMMCVGNELGNSDFDVMEKWIKKFRDSDTRRIYSVSTARKVMKVDQFMATHYLPEKGGTRGLRGAHSDWDFESTYSKSDIPVIAHEIGQWPVYPRWSEIKKYKGTLKARNIEGFKKVAEKNHIANRNDDFVRASGALNQIMYKNEIESFLRTPSCAGIQLLSLQDYQGQGEALIGWLDVFYDSKGITTPERFKQHHDTTVTLLRLPKFVWKNNEILSAKIQLAHYGTGNISDIVEWSITYPSGEIIANGQTDRMTFTRASSSIIDSIHIPLNEILKATKLKINVSLADRAISNNWDIWVYPNEQKIDTENVILAKTLDKETLKKLQAGASVLLDASQLGEEQHVDHISYYPLYWSLTFFPGQGKNTIGMFLQEKHPAFEHFPTDFHSDWQWEQVYKGARAFYLNDYPTSYEAIAQPIDDFHRNNKLGAIFEVKTGKGKLLVCGFPLKDEKNPVIKQLKHSLLSYMNSNQFNPKTERSIDQLQEVFTSPKPAAVEFPPEFENAVLYVECGKNNNRNGHLEWSLQHDKVASKKNCSYALECDGVWKDNHGTAWHGKDMKLTIACPQGMIGSLLIYVEDWNKNGRTGKITFEGREQMLGEHTQGKWIKIHVMREDTNNGTIVLNTKNLTGPNIMISKVVLLEE